MASQIAVWKVRVFLQDTPVNDEEGQKAHDLIEAEIRNALQRSSLKLGTVLKTAVGIGLEP